MLTERKKQKEIRQKPYRRAAQNGRRRIWPIVVIAVLILSVAAGVVSLFLPPFVKSVDVSDELNRDMTLTIFVDVRSRQMFSRDIWCAISEDDDIDAVGAGEWLKTDSGVAAFDVPVGDYYIFAKDSRGNTAVFNYLVHIDEVFCVVLDKETVYMPVDGTDRLKPELTIVGDPDATLAWTSSNTNVVTADTDGCLAAVGAGQATVSATSGNGRCATATVIVSDLFQVAELNNNKPNISTRVFTEAENDVLDAALAYRIDEVGYGTRAGVVAAARFLTLEFPWFIPYFSENGRLNNHTIAAYVDGEGRYYHEGLYLHESRFDDLAAVMQGPAVWGQYLYSIQTGNSSPNGLNCGGFVSWCLLNGGFDVGDSGAGNFPQYDDDLCDLGEQVQITEELLASGSVKAGDLVGLNGHIAIIIGIDDEYIYLAESWWSGLRVDAYERYTEFAHTVYRYIMLMDEVYLDDGNLAGYW